MQDSDNKPKRAGRHAAPAPEVEPEFTGEQQLSPDAPEPAPDDAPITDEYDLLGDEGDIPIRIGKKKSADGRKKDKKKAKPKKRGRKKQEKLFSEKRFHSRRSLFEIMSATDEDSFFKPLTLFGREIRFWPLFLLVLLVMLVGVIVISNGNLKIADQSVIVVGLPEDLENYQILVLSDMNGRRFGDQQSALIREIENIGYDMILCVGDMVGKDGDPEPFFEFLDNLSRPGRVYFVCGDSDPGPFVETVRPIEGTIEQLVLEDWILGAIDRGAHYIDAPTAVTVGETKLWLTPTIFLNLDTISYRENWRSQTEQEEDGVVTGLNSNYASLPFTSYRYNQAKRFYSAVREISATDLLIGLSHVVPDDDFIRSAASHDQESDSYLFEPELIVSGHYCGGMWKLPGLGAFYVPNTMLPRNGWFPAQEDVSGLSSVGESQIFITNGLSNTSSIPVLPFRVFNDPEISVLKLTAKLPDNMLEAK